MAQNEKGRRRANGIALTHTKPESLDSFTFNNTAPKPFRQEGPAAWIMRRVPVSLAAARVYAELHGIGGAHA